MLQTIETPCVLIDLDIAERNIRRFQDHCDRSGIALRPHIKTHKLPQLARAQIDAGAVGITCQKIGEAEVMAEAGLDDILITYNILGDAKLARLAALANKVRLSVVADSSAVVDGLSVAFASATRPLEVLIECDTGAGRCGIQSPAAAVALARRIGAAPGLALAGLLTYPPMGDQAPVERWLGEARQALESAGQPCPRVSTGGTPNLWRWQVGPSATEHRAGTYVYNDRSLVAAGVCTQADCALTVLATVVSRPTETRAIIDAGSKVLTSDLLGLQGFGMVAGQPEVRVAALSEEHGILDLASSTFRPAIGARLRIIPNHACVVSNMVDAVWTLRDGALGGQGPVAARGRVT
jgi:D-serine deaminase-like pyridoxal phosphate-dependent protein